MSIANTMLATQMFDRIKGPIQRIPNIINNWVEVGESVERLQDFLQCDERQPNVLLRKEGNSKDACAVRIKGNFSWGTNPKVYDNNKVNFSRSDRPRRPEHFVNMMRKTMSGSKKKTETADEKDEQVQPKRNLNQIVLLRDISLEIKRGEFVIIIGEIGSGKSSLISSILGEMLYVPQYEIDAFGGFEKELDDKQIE